jgi:hypothetical protein
LQCILQVGLRTDHGPPQSNASSYWWWELGTDIFYFPFSSFFPRVYFLSLPLPAPGACYTTLQTCLIETRFWPQFFSQSPRGFTCASRQPFVPVGNRKKKNRRPTSFPFHHHRRNLCVCVRAPIWSGRRRSCFNEQWGRLGKRNRVKCPFGSEDDLITKFHPVPTCNLQRVLVPVPGCSDPSVWVTTAIVPSWKKIAHTCCYIHLVLVTWSNQIVRLQCTFIVSKESSAYIRNNKQQHSKRRRRKRPTAIKVKESTNRTKHRGKNEAAFIAPLPTPAAAGGDSSVPYNSSEYQQ